MKRREDNLQAAIVAYLRAVLPDAKVAAIPNGGARTPVEGAIFKRTGVLAGMPDLVVILNGGRVAWLEVKADKGRLSDAQSTLGIWLAGRGHLWACVRSVEQVRECLEAWRIETREAV